MNENAKEVLCRLEAAGYAAYLVGGCVRDTLLGDEPHDYDVTTSATPEEVEAVFVGERVIETGIKHGTVTVLLRGEPFEITTFRTDGEYLDSRHPESVTFSRNIEDDLSRRDFTMNSIAMDIRGALVDPYGGREDIARCVIKCTGEPERRFGEDALRIIRALRFSSVLGFEIDGATSDAIHKMRGRLSGISVERVFVEFKKLLCGADAVRVLTDYSDVVCEIIPEMAPAVGFEHRSRYHCYDVYTHILKSVEAIEPDPTLRLVMFLHDVGKPYVVTEEENGTRHFKGHADVSAKIAKDWLERMHADGETVRLVTLLCEIHDRPVVAEKRPVRRIISKYSYDVLLMLCKIKVADSVAHAEEFREERVVTSREVVKIAEEIMRENDCVSLKDLAVRGDDLIALGYRGREIGEALDEVLELVIDEKLENDKDEIIEYLNEKTAK